MDPLDFLEPEQLLDFLHRQKTELSLMEKPHTFLRQLRDYDLIPDELFQKVIHMRTKENKQRGVYTVLDWFERNRPKSVHRFWNCAFRDSIRNQYPTLQQLHTSLMDGSFKFNSQLHEKEEEEEEEEEECEKKMKKQQKRKSECEDNKDEEEERVGSVKKKLRKRRGNCINNEEEEAAEAEPQPGPSGQLKKKSKKVLLYSPLRKGEQTDIWTWPIYKTQLPVTCGSEEATLSRERLAKGEKCILFQKRWFYPGEFERLAGKEQCRNWKTSIKCLGTTLDKLFQDGHLETVGFPRKQTRRLLFPLEEISDDDAVEAKEAAEEEEEEEEEQLTVRLPQGNGVFEVTCGGLAATLHQRRFATGTCGKCLRTDTKWLSPEQFAKEATGRSDAKWKRDILHRGRPLADLMMDETLKIHSPQCECALCDPDEESLEDQRNDDECCVCKRDSALVLCDNCPRSFHQKCHLPQIPDSVIGNNCPWWCTFCVTSQPFVHGQEQDMKTALAQPISNQLSKCHRLILYLYCADDKQTFNHSGESPAPSWLREVEHNVQTEEYESVKEFEEDVRRIIRRCATNNTVSHQFPALKLFQAEFKKVFNIVE